MIFPSLVRMERNSIMKKSFPSLQDSNPLLLVTVTDSTDAWRHKLHQKDSESTFKYFWSQVRMWNLLKRNQRYRWWKHELLSIFGYVRQNVKNFLTKRIMIFFIKLIADSVIWSNQNLLWNQINIVDNNWFMSGYYFW